MKRIFGLLFLLTCSISVVSQTKATSFPGAGFKAAFPNKPEVVKNDVDSKVGKIETTTYNCEGEDFLILLSESIYPSELIKKLDGTGIQGILDGAKNGAVKNIETQLGGKFVLSTDEKFLFKDKYSAAKFGGVIDDVALETLCIVKDNHFFIVMVIGNTKSEVALQFVNSFQLNE
jgi:hypothetical protein